MRAYLKIKIKSLAAEAKIIRTEELKYKRRVPKIKGTPKAELKAHPRRLGKSRLIPGTMPSKIFWGLRSHRTHDVRYEARAACLAYGFLRGRPYAVMEQKCHTFPNFKRIEELIVKYGEGDVRERQQKFAQWLDEAKEHVLASGWTKDKLPPALEDRGVLASIRKTLKV